MFSINRRGGERGQYLCYQSAELRIVIGEVGERRGTRPLLCGENEQSSKRKSAERDRERKKERAKLYLSLKEEWHLREEEQQRGARHIAFGGDHLRETGPGQRNGRRRERESTDHPSRDCRSDRDSECSTAGVSISASWSFALMTRTRTQNLAREVIEVGSVPRDFPLWRDI